MFSPPLRPRLKALCLLLAVLASLAPNPSAAAPAVDSPAIAPVADPVSDLMVGPPADPAAAAATPGRLFPDTGHMLDAQFIGYYDKNSGTRVLGSPITEVYQEDGRTVQVFERGRLEYDAGAGKVTPTALGRLLTQGRSADAAVAAPDSDPQGLFDATTGHAVGAVFADYWKAAGAGAVLGRPITELTILSAEPLRYVQYFEFARLETDANGQVLSRLQDNVRAAGSPFAQVAKPATTKGQLFVPASGHIVRGGFYDLYRTLGGAETMGAPLTEETWENGLTVQYFQWAKLEWHKDLPQGKQIIQTALGRDWLLDHPAPATAMVARSDYQVLGSATTSFRDSIPGRVHNLTLATQRLNGVVVQPGAVFSFNKALGPDGESAGFVIAKIIYNGRTIDGIGGGICQVATTAFRAAFYSGVDIVERHPHTYRVSFYEPPVGFDATVFSDQGVDLRWRNNLTVPVLIQTAVDTRAQTINFTYLATEPAKYKAVLGGPVISDIIKHGPPIYEDDPKLAYGKTTQTEHAKDGMTTTITRTLLDPATGKTVRTETYTSRYVAWNDRFSRGTKGKPAAPKATAAPTQDSVPTQAPAQTPAQTPAPAKP